MDVKTLSTIIGHVSSATTLNTYTHVTDEMRQKAAANIDRGIAKAERQPEPEQETEKPHAQESFTPGPPPPRGGGGTGYVKQLNDHLWEGRYSPVWPDGKKLPECLRPHGGGVRGKAGGTDPSDESRDRSPAFRGQHGYPDGVSPKKKAIAAYLREYPGVTNKAKIARDLNMDRTTVQRYYDEIRVELRGEESPALQM